MCTPGDSEPMLQEQGEQATYKRHKLYLILDILHAADTVALLWARLGRFEQNRRFTGPPVV